MTIRVDTETLAVLSRGTAHGHALKLTDQLDRKAYESVARVIEAAGGRWDKKAQAHLFAGRLAQDAIEQVLLTGEIASVRQELGAFFTPPVVVALAVATADLEPGLEVLEPSAGRGALAMPAVEAGCRVDCVEIDARNCAVLYCGPYRRVLQADFLLERPWASYDRVLMNPPFARQHDCAHVRHAARFLRPGGRLVAIVSAGVMFRTDDRTEHLRRLVEAGAGHAEALPDGSFKPSGTMVHTALITFEATPALARVLAEP